MTQTLKEQLTAWRDAQVKQAQIDKAWASQPQANVIEAEERRIQQELIDIVKRNANV